MNKIIISKNKINDKEIGKDIIVLDQDTEIYYYNSEVNLTFTTLKPVHIFEYICHSTTNNKYIVEEDTVINRFAIDSDIKTALDLTKEKKEVKYYYSCINLNNHDYEIDINHLACDTSSYVLSHGLNLFNKKLDFLINTRVFKDISGVTSDQDSRILLLGENHSIIKPNLLVDNYDVVCNHSAYIGSFKKADLFYLMSRGLDDNEAKKLLSKAFIFSGMELTFEQKKLILEDFEMYWR